MKPPSSFPHDGLPGLGRTRVKVTICWVSCWGFLGTFGLSFLLSLNGVSLVISVLSVLLFGCPRTELITASHLASFPPSPYMCTEEWKFPESQDHIWLVLYCIAVLVTLFWILALLRIE